MATDSPLRQSSSGDMGLSPADRRKLKEQDIIQQLKDVLHPSVLVDNVGFENRKPSVAPIDKKTLRTVKIDKNAMFSLPLKGTKVIWFEKSGKQVEVMMKLGPKFDHIQIGDQKIFLRSIVELRKGQKTKTFKKHKSPSVDTLYFLSLSIIYGIKQHSIDVAFKTDPEFDQWIFALLHFAKESKRGETELAYISRVWDEHDKEKNSVDIVEKMLRELNVSAKSSFISERFNNVDADKDGKINYDEFVDLCNRLKSRPEFDSLFKKYSANGEYLDAQELLRFYKGEQKETDMTLPACELLVKHFEKRQRNPNPKGLSRLGFDMLLSSDLNAALNPKHNQLYQPMDKPMSHYFIASSHNTYLEGHQLTGESSTDQYMNVLKSGCRCIELDCWDGKDGEPEITHGHTLTSKVKFIDVLKTINDYAFVSSPYPVTLSIELHCTKPQQIKMAQYFTQVFKEKLPKPIIDKKMESLPSPEDLKFKILIKGKRIAESGTSTGHTSLRESSNAAGEKDEEEEEEIADEKLAKELSDLVYLNGTSKFKGFSMGVPWDMYSFTETKLKKHHEKIPREWVNYNINHLSRIFPKGSRVDSSNYNPMPAWTAGVQMVALNYQTSSEPMWMNLGLFKDNGGSGYVMKPSFMLGASSPWNPNEPGSVAPSVIKKVEIEIISARQLPKPGQTTKGSIIDPFVSLTLHGIGADHKTFKTATVKDNGFSPNWNETFVVSFVCSELAMLVFSIEDEDALKTNHIGHAAIRVESLRSGVRSIQLYDDQHQKIPMANLICRFTIHTASRNLLQGTK